MRKEIVTHASARVVPVLGLAKPVVLITLDNGRGPLEPNTFGREGLRSLDAAFDEAMKFDPAAIALIGKPFCFSIGADLAAIGMDRATTLIVGKQGHDAFRRFTDSAVPTFCFLNGMAIGGGLELALACHYRTVAADVAAISFPECALGLFQGWGGTQLLPNLIGPHDAVSVIFENALDNKMLDASEATKIGIADIQLDPADFVDASMRWLVDVVNGEITVPRTEFDRGSGWDAALTRAREIVEAKTHGASPGPLRALELFDLARHRDLDRGYLAESEAMADVLLSDELRASLYALGLVQVRANTQPKTAVAETRSVQRVGIVGTEPHASQLALIIAMKSGLPVVVCDRDQARVKHSVNLPHVEIDALLVSGGVLQDDADRLRSLVSGSSDWKALRTADFVFEVVDEELKTKRQVLADIETCVSSTCVLATTTTLLSVTDIATGLINPERVIGVSYAAPIAVSKIFEVILGNQTDPTTVATTLEFCKAIGRTAVLVSDTPSFLLNRVLARFFGEILKFVDEGASFHTAENALYSLGLSRPPSQMLELVGAEQLLRVTERLQAAYPDRFAVSRALQQLALGDRPGVPQSSTASATTLDSELQSVGHADSAPPTPNTLLNRVSSALADEVRHILDEGVVSEPQDLDLALILGMGFPFWLGGITPFLDRTGASERVAGRRFLGPGVASAEKS